MSELGLSMRGQILQGLTLVAVVAVLVVELVWARLNRFRWRYGVPVILLMLHTLAYYLSVLGYLYAGLRVESARETFTDWSALLRWHSVTTWLMLESTRLLNYRREHGRH